MSGDLVYKGKQYRLRAGSPINAAGGNFVLHTFMAEENEIDSIIYTNNLPSSTDFRGRGGNYMSANFSRLPDKSGNVFSGKIVYNPKYIDEDDIGN